MSDIFVLRVVYENIKFSLNNHNLEKEKKIAVAVSGGIDSLSLILIANEWAKKKKIDVIGITVDHGLRKNSAKEAGYISKLLKSKKIKHYVSKWEGTKPKKNIEAIAREKRYELLTEFCKKQGIKVLLVGHHLQDQAETFFIRLFRGSGIDGLASMKEYMSLNGVKIVRPFLNVEKEDLRQYLVKKKIKWIEDESNKDERFLRNKIRKFLNGFEDKSDILKRIDFAVKEIAKAKDLIENKVEKLEKEVLKFDKRGFYKVDLEKFRSLEEDLALRILAKCLMRVSGNIYKPRLEKLKRLYEKILKGLKKETFYGCVLQNEKKEGIFWIFREYSAIKGEKALIFKKLVFWDNRFKIFLNRNLEGLKISHLKKGEFRGLLRKLKSENYKKYKELKNLKGVEKEVFYTLPIIRKKEEIILNLKEVGAKIVDD